MNKNLSFCLILLIMCGSCFSVAEQESAGVSIKSMVNPGCYISTIQNVIFFDMDGIFLSDVTSSSGSITVVCTLDTFYSIGINNGQNAVGDQRRMTSINGENYIRYELFRDGAYQNAWGDTATSNVKVDIGSGNSQTHTIYARIPSAQAPVRSGSYSDQVIVTLSF